MPTALEELGLAVVMLPSNDGVMEVGTTTRKSAEGFSGAAYAAGAASIAALQALGWIVVKDIGGMVETLNNGNLSVNMGVANNAELVLISKEAATIPANLTATLSMSQRIAGNLVRIGYVECDEFGAMIANPNVTDYPRNGALMCFDGATATTARCETICDGSTVKTVSTTTVTTAAAGDFTLEVRPEDVTFASQVSDSSALRSTGGSRTSTVVPNPNKLYRTIIWLKNTAVPASATTVTINRILSMDIQELQAEVGGGRGNALASQTLPVSVQGTATVSGNVSNCIGYTDSVAALGVSATFTGTARTQAASNPFTKFAAMAYADQAGTLFIDQSLDSGATFQPVASAACAANTPCPLSVAITGAFVSTVVQYRVRFVNGGVAQTLFRLSSSLLSLAG